VAIAFRAKSGGDLNSVSGTFAVTKPVGTASTDVMVASITWDVHNDPATTLTPPSGWTTIANPLTNSTIKSAVFWSLGSNASLTFTEAGISVSNTGWVIGSFTGVDNTTPVDATGTTSTSANSQTVTSNAVTAVTANALNMVALGAWNGPSTLAASGWTVQVNATTPSFQESDLAYKAISATGSTGTTAFTASGQVASGQLLNAIPFVLRPAGGAAAFLAVPCPRYGRQAVHRANSY
jgi:hypothetical protein